MVVAFKAKYFGWYFSVRARCLAFGSFERRSKRTMADEFMGSVRFGLGGRLDEKSRIPEERPP